MKHESTGSPLVRMPERKSRNERKRALSVTVMPDHLHWLHENYTRLGFRSQSHAIDVAIELLKESRSKRPLVE